jgi:hypothetical protein
MNPEDWTNFFTLVGSGSAALAGLVFVAITINLRGVAEDATHRYRAINMLTGFSSAFIISALALMGRQTSQAVGLEWLIVALPAMVINTNGYIQGFRRRGSSRYALSAFRIVGGSACYLGQVIGSVMLLLGADSGIYVAAVALVANFAFLISGSWLLIVGTLPRSD